MREYKDFNFAVPNSVDYANGCVVASGTHGDGSHMPIVRKKERDYEGMFEFRKEDINLIIRHMVIGEFRSHFSYQRTFLEKFLHLNIFEFIYKIHSARDVI